VDVLNQASYKVAEKLYQSTGEAPGAEGAASAAGAPEATGETPPDEGVVDAEYTEVKDDKDE
jgi:molecular chaperone DnaK